MTNTFAIDILVRRFDDLRYMIMSKKNTQSHNAPDLRVINGDMNAESYGLGDPCVPMELSYFPEENPKSRALLSEVDSRND